MSATQRVIIVGGGPNLLQEIDNSGNVLSRYTQGAYVDELRLSPARHSHCP